MNPNDSQNIEQPSTKSTTISATELITDQSVPPTPTPTPSPEPKPKGDPHPNANRATKETEKGGFFNYFGFGQRTPRRRLIPIRVEVEPPTSQREQDPDSDRDEAANDDFDDPRKDWAYGWRYKAWQKKRQIKRRQSRSRSVSQRTPHLNAEAETRPPPPPKRKTHQSGTSDRTPHLNAEVEHLNRKIEDPKKTYAIRGKRKPRRRPLTQERTPSEAEAHSREMKKRQNGKSEKTPHLDAEKEHSDDDTEKHLDAEKEERPPSNQRQIGTSEPTPHLNAEVEAHPPPTKKRRNRNRGRKVDGVIFKRVGGTNTEPSLIEIPSRSQNLEPLSRRRQSISPTPPDAAGRFRCSNFVRVGGSWRHPSLKEIFRQCRHPPNEPHRVTYHSRIYRWRLSQSAPPPPPPVEGNGKSTRRQRSISVSISNVNKTDQKPNEEKSPKSVSVSVSESESPS